ncbi:MAG: DNA alkylation repair protein [Candidatus Cryptobacteroides sp.]
MTMNNLLDEMISNADPSQVAGLSRFFKTGPGQYGEGDVFLGIKVPVTRAVVKKCWQACSFEDIQECLASRYHEARLAGLLALVQIFSHSKKAPARQKACVDLYLENTGSINNWDLVDLSCYPLLGTWLLDKDRSLLYDLARNGRTIWEQRIGIVSTMTFIRNGQPDDTFAIADILLHHPHDLIHKAVGWLLREAGKRDKSKLTSWLTEDIMENDAPVPRFRTMPRTMLRYAIEKFPEDERQKFLTR